MEIPMIDRFAIAVLCSIVSLAAGTDAESSEQTQGTEYERHFPDEVEGVDPGVGQEGHSEELEE